MNSSSTRRPQRRRGAAYLSGRGRRIFAAGVMVAVLGGTVAVSQISSAGENGAPYSSTSWTGTSTRTTSGTDATASGDSTQSGASNVQSSGAETVQTKAARGNGLVINGLQVVGRSCQGSDLRPHTGFQAGDRCVNTQFGEVSVAARNPSLLITGAPRVVRVKQKFNLQVSTRNLVRDRFLGAKDGGYYLEASFLTGNGLQRGHFHTACRMLVNNRVAQNPAPDPAFFKATEDGKGGAQPDTVTVAIDGMPTTGLAQCAVWAGDGSHRVPMMERANQIPAFDVIRIQVVN